MSPEDAPPKDDELVAPDTYEGDAHWLKKNFSGKTRAQAIRMFELRAAANIADDYLWMSHIGLAYYLPAALSYLKSPTSERDDGFLDWITTALSVRCETDDHLPAEIRKVIGDIADYLKGHLQKFTCCKDPAHIDTEYLSRLESMAQPEY
jgi:hypothetical protein